MSKYEIAINISSMAAWILGTLFASYGAWLLKPAFGFITCGVLLMLWSYLVSTAGKQANKSE